MGTVTWKRALLDWSQTEIDPVNNRKSTSLLSHYQNISAPSSDLYRKPATANEVKASKINSWVWLRGHEHRLAIYDRFSKDGGVTVVWTLCGARWDAGRDQHPVPTKAPLLYFDPRERQLSDGTTVGENGYVVLSIDGPALNLEYRYLAVHGPAYRALLTRQRGELTCDLLNVSTISAR